MFEFVIVMMIVKILIRKFIINFGPVNKMLYYFITQSQMKTFIV